MEEVDIRIKMASTPLLMSTTNKENKDKINKHFISYFSEYGKPKRLNGEDLPINTCAINLNLINNYNNNSNNNSKKEEEEEEEEEVDSDDDEVDFTIDKNVEVLCHPRPENLLNSASEGFNNDDNLYKSVKCLDVAGLLKLLIQCQNISKILVLGGGNMGKTTLCKKLIHTFYHNNEVKNLAGYGSIEFIIWVPLQSLVSFFKDKACIYAGVCTASGFFEKYICHEYFSSSECEEEEGKDLAKLLVKEINANKGNIMYILDDLHEIVGYLENDRLGKRNFIAKLIYKLLAKPHLICTSRPYALHLSYLNNSFSVQYSLVGLSLRNVTSYIKKVVPDMAKEIKGFIRQYNFIAGLINIPGYLDLLCSCWKEINDTLNKRKEEDILVLNMTMLHEAMLNDLLRVHAKYQRSKEIQNPRDSPPPPIDDMSPPTLQEEFSCLLIALEEIAFKGLQEDQLVLPSDPVLAQTLKESPFLISHDNLTVTLHERNYEFISYIVQEYLAARYIAKNITTMADFILANKYNIKYQIVWWYVSGFLASSKKASPQLTLLFNWFQGPPRDLFHVYHYNVLLAGCLYECHHVLDQRYKSKLYDTLTDWLSHPIQTTAMYGIRPLLIAYLPDEVSLQLVDKLKDGDKLRAKAAYLSLRSQRSLGPDTINALIELFSSTALSLADPNKFRLLKQISKILSKQICVVDETKLRQVLVSTHEFKIKKYLVQALNNQTNLHSETINTLLPIVFDTKYDEDDDCSTSDLVNSIIILLQNQNELEPQVKKGLVNHFKIYINKYRAFSESRSQNLAKAYAASELLLSLASSSLVLVDKIIQLIHECNKRIEEYNSTPDLMIALTKIYVLRALSAVEDTEGKVEHVLLKQLFSYTYMDRKSILKHQPRLNLTALAFISARRQRLSQGGQNFVSKKTRTSSYPCLYTFVVVILNPSSNQSELEEDLLYNYDYEDHSKEEGLLSYFNVEKKPKEARQIYKKCLGTPAQDILEILLKKFGMTFDNLNEVGSEQADDDEVGAFKNEEVDAISCTELEIQLGLDVECKRATLNTLKSKLEFYTKDTTEQTTLRLFNMIKSLLDEVKEKKALASNVEHAAYILSTQIKTNKDDHKLITTLVECVADNSHSQDSFIKGEVIAALRGLEQPNEKLEQLQVKLLFDANIDSWTRFRLISELNKLDELSESGLRELNKQLNSHDIPEQLLLAYCKEFYIEFTLEEGALNANTTTTTCPTCCRTKTQGKVTKTILTFIKTMEGFRDKKQDILTQFEKERAKDNKLITRLYKSLSSLDEVDDCIISTSQPSSSLVDKVINKGWEIWERKESAKILANYSLSKEHIDRIISCCAGSLEGVQLIITILEGGNNLGHVSMTQLINILCMVPYEELNEELLSLESTYQKLVEIHNSPQNQNAFIYKHASYLLQTKVLNSSDLLLLLQLMYIAYTFRSDGEGDHNTNVVVFERIVNILQDQNFNELINVAKKCKEVNGLRPENVKVLYKYVLQPMSMMYYNVSAVLIESKENKDTTFIQAIRSVQAELKFPPDACLDDLTRGFMYQNDIKDIRATLESILEFQSRYDNMGHFIQTNSLHHLCRIKISKGAGGFNGDLEELITNALKTDNYVHLDLSNNSLRTKHMRQLCKALESPLASELKSLILSHNLFTYADLEYLLKYLAPSNSSRSPKIEFLFIDHNLIYSSEAEFNALVHGFKLSGGESISDPLFHSKLSLIDISMNYFGSFIVNLIENPGTIHYKYQKPVKTLIGQDDVNNLLSAEVGAISLIVRSSSGTFSISGHTSLVIERIQPNFRYQRELIKADLTYCARNGKIVIDIANVSPEYVQKLYSNRSCWIRTGWIHNDKIQKLLDRLVADKSTAQYLTYSILNVFNRRGLYSCYSYVVDRLKDVGIDIEWTYFTRRRPSVGCQIQ